MKYTLNLIKEKLAFPLIAILVLWFYMMPDATNKFDYNPYPPKFYNTAGQVMYKQAAVFDDVLVPTSGTQTIDYSSAGFTSIRSITITGENNSASITSLPTVAIKTWSLTSCTVSILVSNNQVVSVLGATVTPIVLATTLTGMKLHVHIVGNQN